MVFASKNAIAHRRNAAVQTSSRWWIYGSMVRIYSLVAAARATRCWISHGWLPQLAGTLTAGFWTWTLRWSPWLWFSRIFGPFFHFFSPPPWLSLSSLSGRRNWPAPLSLSSHLPPRARLPSFLGHPRFRNASAPRTSGGPTWCRILPLGPP